MPEWIGKTIGNVRIEKLLARGGMAEVYLGSHVKLERPVAIKLLHSYIEEEPLLLDRFQREARVVAGLRHSNIVQIFDFDTIDGHPYIVMEYLRGPTLAAYLRHLHQRKKRIPSEQVARLLHELSAALDYAHSQGVVHRDIKPGNIMLHSKSNDISLDKPLTDEVGVVITDFGLVRIMNAATQTASGTVSGTPAYMSPEQARGDQTDHRTDVYSLGIVLYEMLAGRVPFEADSTLTVLHMQIHTIPPPIPGIPPKVQEVIDRALKKSPDDRYQSSREFADDYARSIGLGRQVLASPVSSKPIDASAPRRPMPEPEPEPPKPQPKIEPPPTKLEPKPQKESEMVAAPPRKPEPKPQKEPDIVVEQPRKPEPKPAPAPEPARNRSWVSVGLLSLVGLAILAAGAYWIFSQRQGSPPPGATATSNVQGVTPATSPVPSEPAAAALPSPERMAQVPAGSYTVGVPQPDQFHVTPRSISLESFWIDQYETTNEEYQKFMDATGVAAPIVALGPANFPVRGVDFEQAKAYCQWLNKRLPKEAEWEASGRGPGENPRIYPSEDPTFTLNLPNDLYGVGTLANNVSPFEVYDLVGNVWEWVDEPYEPVPPDKNVLRGGRFGNPQDLAFRFPIALDNSNVQYAGFRCAASEVSQ